MNQPAGAQVGLKLTGTGESNNVEVGFSAATSWPTGATRSGRRSTAGGPRWFTRVTTPLCA